MKTIEFNLSFINIMTAFVLIPLMDTLIQNILIVLLIPLNILYFFAKGVVIRNDMKYILLNFFILLCWYFLLLVNDVEGYPRVLQWLAVCSVFYYFAVEKLDKRDLLLLSFIASIYIVSWVVYIPFSTSILAYSAYLPQKNTLGSMCVSMATILLIKINENRIVNIMLWVMLLIALFLSGSRGSMLSIMIMIVVYYLFNKKLVKFNSYNVTKLFLLFLFAIFNFTVIYPAIFNTDLGAKLNELSLEIFSQNFYSGRQLIWSMLLDIINQNFYIGHGLSAKPMFFMDTEFSSHNLYLQVLLQSGIIGLLLLLSTLFSILIALTKNKNRISYVSVGLLLGMLVHESFEVSLTQNNLATGLIIWALLAIGVSKESQIIR